MKKEILMEDSLVQRFEETIWEYNEEYQKEIVFYSFLKCLEGTGLFDESDDMINLLEHMAARFEKGSYVERIIREEILRLKIVWGY